MNGKQWAVGLRVFTVHSLLFTAYSLLFTACAVTRPVVKIGLVAPFEGRYREVGYEVIYAARLAVREANAAGGVAGYSVELFALDDGGDPAMAVEQTKKLAADSQVLGVIGHWRGETTIAAASEYERTGIPLLATGFVSEALSSAFTFSPLPADCSSMPCFETVEDIRLRAVLGEPFTVPSPLPVDTTDPSFAERYREISNGVEPGFNAVLAYDATRLLLDAIARDAAQNGTATRSGVAEALAQSDFVGLSGAIRFDENRERADAEGWVYQWSGSGLVKP